MQVLGKFFGEHSENLANAMNRTTQRHALLTKNLANVNVPGYKREDIDFGIVLDGEEAGGDNIGRLKNSLGGNQNQGNNNSIRIDGNSVDLEKEVMSIAESELRYQMLSELTSKYFSGLKSVIREGR